MNRLSLHADQVLSVDFGRLRARLRALEQAAVAPDDERWQRLREDIAKSEAKREARAASVPAIALDDSLPITAEAERIVDLIRRHPVVVIAGETGSGKTTQLPKLCLAAGRGVSGLIGCTQPRRIAARSVARRVAQELATDIGRLVGFQVRFTEQVGEQALIKFMTDGILLAETQGDALLSRYDTLIIDEAHERSLNIDFLLGYLKRLVAKRRDLKVIVTSATIDTERFARHFGDAPIVHVEGRTYPVEVRWRPPSPDGEDAREASGAVVAAIDEITRQDALGDVLIFLPGEREIRDTHLALERRKYRETEVLPLYARLSARDQDRVFNPGPKRRLVLATNVAETSLTVPRIRYVVDPGVARVNRFSHRHKVQRLHIEPISQASADQRKGRCGRVGPGVCYRLYDEADFAQRARYTDPELLRSSLAGVILRLMSLRLGPIEQFPFLDRPNERAIADGYQQLIELGAITIDRQRLTEIGRTLAKLPIDVKLGRILVEAREQDALRELTVIAAFLAIQDPRERPADARELADNAHKHYADPRSDFIGVLNLWNEYRVAHEELTQAKLRDWCATRFLNFLRLREWRELHRQLLLLVAELGWTQNAEPAKYEAIHRALLSGLPGQVAHRDEKQQYLGTRGRKYTPFPGSALARKPPAWMMSATLLDTQRLYGLTNAEVQPEWIEQQAAHLTKKRHFDPHWARSQGRVLGYESVSLFGLVLVERRRVAYGNIDPVGARAVFIREALLPGEIDCRAAFVARNLRTLEDARAEESKRRRHGLVRDDDELCAWLDARLPPDISTAVALDAWYKTLDSERRHALCWTLDDVLAAEASPEREFPASLRIGAHELRLDYRFEPGHIADGVTLILPLGLLNAVPSARLTWLVPGLLRERVAELIRALPKSLRRNFVPAPDFARAFVEAVAPDRRALDEALSTYFSKLSGIEVVRSEWRETELPAHLRFNVRLLDERGEVLAESRDLEALRAQFGTRAREQFARDTANDIAREGLTRWDFDDLAETVATDTGLMAFPALVDLGEAVAIRVYEQRDEARAAHAAGVFRLLRLALAEKLKTVRRQVPLSPKVAIAYTAIASPEALREDIADAVFTDLARDRCVDVRARAVFEALTQDISKALGPAAVKRVDLVEEILIAYAELVPKLTPPLLGFAKANFDDLREQLAGLVHPGFVRALAVERLREIPRYLRAMIVRVGRLINDPRKDQARMIEVREFVDAWHRLRAHPRAATVEADLDRLRWAIEEFRVQVFAQELKTREAVSDKRLRALAENLASRLA